MTKTTENLNLNSVNDSSESGFSVQDFDDLMGIEEGPETTDPDADADSNADADADASKPVDGQNADATGDSNTTPDTEPAEDSIEYWRKRAEAMEVQLANAYKPTHAEPEKPEEEKPIEGSTLFGEWKFDDIIENEDSFKKFLGDFANKVRVATKESILKDLPQTVTRLTTEQIETRKIVTEFYEDNKELQTVKPFVAQVTNQVASEHPDWTLPKVLAETAVRSYNALGLRKKVSEESSGNKQRKPAFVDTTRTRRGDPNPQKSKLEKELEELMDLE